MTLAPKILFALILIAGTILAQISPSEIPLGSKNVVLTVKGTKFVKGSSVMWNDTSLPTTFISSSQLTATVPPELLVVVGTINITVRGPSTAALKLNVIAPQTSLTVSPSTAPLVQQVAGGPLARDLNFTVSKDWAAQIEGDPFWRLPQTQGVAAASLGVGWVDWRMEGLAPGDYTAKLKVTSGPDTLSVPLSLHVEPKKAPPTISFFTGFPQGCTQAAGYLDPELCHPSPDTFQPDKGVAFVDQTYGGKIRIATAPGTYHTYSTPNPLSASNKYLLVFKSNGFFDLLTADGSLVTQNVSANQSFVWDADNDDRYYYTSGSHIMMHSVAANTETIIKDYGLVMTDLKRGGTGDTSKDNWMPFWSPNEHQACVFDLGSKETYCADYSLVTGGPDNIDFVLVSKGVDLGSKKRYVIVAGAPANIVYSVNLTTKKLDFEYLGPRLPDRPASWYLSHADTLEVNGLQYVVFNDYNNIPCVFTINTVLLSSGVRAMDAVEIGGGRSSVFPLWRCGAPTWPDEHVGCAKKAPYCVISTQSAARNLDEQQVYSPHINALILMKGNGEEIQFLGLSHTVKARSGNDNYWSTPRAAISNDGTTIVFDSTYGTATGPRVSILTKP